MYLAYVDDYGHTGLDLANTQQPVYMLFTLLVSEERWPVVESSLWAIIVEIADKTGQDLEGFELHAKDFFNGRNRVYAALTFEEKIGYLNQIIRLIAALECKCIATYLVKPKLQELREHLAAEKAAGRPAPSDRMMSILFPHPLAFSRLLAEVDSFSRLAGRNSIVVMDHQEEYVESRRLNAHALYRHTVEPDSARILDLPFDGDGRYNIMLQIADLLGYVFGRHLKHVELSHNIPLEMSATVTTMLPFTTATNVLREFNTTLTMPFAEAIFLEYMMRADKAAYSGKRRVEFLSALLAGRPKEKGKEYPDG